MSSGPITPYVDFGTNPNDSNENNAASIQPIVNGDGVNATSTARPSENLRKRTEALRGHQVDSLYLENADRVLVITGPGKVSWPGSTTALGSGILVLSDVLWILPLLTPGFPQAAPIPPVASAFGVIHLKRASDNMNSIAVASRRRSYAAGDQINITVTSGGSYSCTLDTEDTGALQRTVKIVATGATTLGTVIASLNALTPPAPDNTVLVSAALEGGALSGDLILTAQARQFMSGNYDGEGHAITPANLASFFASNPSQALAEGDSLCLSYSMLYDSASTGGRRQSIPENSNTAVPAGAFFNSRVHPEQLVNALPVCKVVNGSLVFGTGTEIPAGASAVSLTGAAASISYGGGNAWADGTTNPATTVENQFDKIITDLGAGAGSAKIHGAAVDSYLVAGTLAAQVTQLEALARRPVPLNEADINPLHAFLDFNNKPRFLVDHSGFPMGQISAIDENWHLSVNAPFSNPNPPGWALTAAVGGTVTFTDPGPLPSTLLNHRGVRLHNVTGGPTDAAQIVSVNEVLLTSSLSYVLEFPVWLTTGSTAQHPLVKLGITDSQTPATRLGFQYDHSIGVNWLVTFGVDSSLTVIDTGVAVADGTLFIMRLEFLGAAVSGSAQTRVRAYINGALVANQTSAGFPAASVAMAIELLCNATIAAATDVNVTVGRVRRAWGHLNNSYTL